LWGRRFPDKGDLIKADGVGVCQMSNAVKRLTGERKEKIIEAIIGWNRGWSALGSTAQKKKPSIFKLNIKGILWKI